MRARVRTVLLAGVVVVAAAALLLGGGVLLAPGAGRGSPPPAPSVSVAAAGSGQQLTGAIARAQQRLRAVPRDHTTWAELGLAYVQQARLAADPSYYPRAQGALEQSLRVRPDDNPTALTGLAALAAARHDFTGALRFGRRSLALNPYSATAHGVVGDAAIELGRYGEGFASIQRMVDLRPDTASYARASYAWELRGDLPRARQALQLALDVAPTPDDAGFALYYLGELAWNAGDLDTAWARYSAGLRRAPDYLPLQEGRAKVLAARGDAAEAVAVYRSLVTRLPQPAYAIALGDLLDATGDRTGAAEQYALVRATQRLLTANGVAIDQELALFDADHGAPVAALAAARRAYATRRDVFTTDALAWALHVVGRDAEALPYTRAAARLGTRSALLRYHRGVIERALGQRAAARRDLTAALALNPYFSVRQAPHARAVLGTLR